MAAPSISTYILSSSSHYYGSEGGAAVMTSPSDSVTKVSAIISQTSGGAAIETVDTTVKTSSDLYADRWALSWHTAGITASPYYVRMWATNSDGDGTVREVAPYIYFPPAVSVTSPVDGSTLTDSSVTMAWTAADDYGISYQRASVSHDGTELWGAEVEGNSIAVPSSVVFENGESYSFSVTARNGKGMESTATNTASFSFVAPSVPELVIAEGDGKSASITVTDSSYTESGTVLEASSAMMESLTINGLSVQDGTPTPSEPVAIESVQGRNLLEITASQSTINHVTFTPQSDGTILVSGTASPAAFYSCATLTLAAGTYMFAGYANGTLVSTQTHYRIYIYITSPNISANSGTSFTLTQSASATVYIQAVAGETFDAETVGIMLTAGSTLTAFQPYGAVDVKTIGKNLFDFPSYAEAMTGEIVNTYRCTPIKLKPNTTYYLSTYTADGYTSVGKGMYVLVATTSSNTGYRCIAHNTQGNTSGTLTTGSDGLLWFNCYPLSQLNYDEMAAHTTVQLEIGSTATAYEPYSGSATPIPVTLRSLPDGTHDEWISGETEDTHIQRVGETMQAVTDGVTGTVGVDVLSSTGEIANGAQVLYKLATPVTTTYPHVNLPYVDGSAWVDAEVTPQIEATFRPVDFPDQPAADSVDVVRVNADGTTWTVASNLTVGDTVTDPLPPLGVDAVYKAVGKTSSGGMSEKLYMHGIPTTGWVLNFGDAAQETVEFIYNPQATMTLAQGGESYHFADGGMGGGFPVFYPTTDRDASGTLAFDTVLYGDSDRLLDLCRRYPVAWLRDPFGHRWRAHVRPSVSHGVGQVWPVTIAWDAVRFEEV